MPQQETSVNSLEIRQVFARLNRMVEIALLDHARLKIDAETLTQIKAGVARFPVADRDGGEIAFYSVPEMARAMSELSPLRAAVRHLDVAEPVSGCSCWVCRGRRLERCLKVEQAASAQQANTINMLKRKVAELSTQLEQLEKSRRSYDLEPQEFKADRPVSFLTVIDTDGVRTTHIKVRSVAFDF